MNNMLFSHIQSRHIPQQRRLGLLRGLLLAVLATAGCIRVEPTPFPTWTPPEDYVTAKEAYAHALPTIQQWEQEFVVGGITAPSFDVAAWRPRQDGTAAVWYFRVFGPTRWTIFSYSDGSVRDEGCSDKSDRHKCPDMQIENPIPMEQIVDSDEAVAIARRNGVSEMVRVTEITEAVFDSAKWRERRLTWLLMFDVPEGADKWVYVDMLTGEILHNEFADTTPSPTNETQP
jgi:hypothetical protein